MQQSAPHRGKPDYALRKKAGLSNMGILNVAGRPFQEPATEELRLITTSRTRRPQPTPRRQHLVTHLDRSSGQRTSNHHTHAPPPTSADPTHLHNTDSTTHNHPTPNRLQKIEERWQSAPRRKNSVTHFGRKRASRIWVSYTSQARIIKARHAQQLDILCKIIKAKSRTYAEAPLIIFNTQKARP